MRHKVACFVLAVEDGREVQVVMIGREGAVGGIVSRGRLPAFSRSVVRIGGHFVRLPIARLEAAKAKSPSLANLFARYADCLLAQTLEGQSGNAEQRSSSVLQRRPHMMALAEEGTHYRSAASTSAKLGVSRTNGTRLHGYEGARSSGNPGEWNMSNMTRPRCAENLVIATRRCGHQGRLGGVYPKVRTRPHG